MSPEEDTAPVKNAAETGAESCILHEKGTGITIP